MISVTAQSYSSYTPSIGLGREGSTCGTITIGGTVYYNGTTNTWFSETLENALKVATFTYPAP